MKKTVWMIIAWIICINVFALVAWNRFDLVPDTVYTGVDTYHQPAATWNPFDMPVRGDSQWYLDIAKNGYAYRGAEELSNLVFFPMYPVLIRFIGILLLGNYVAAGWMISLVSLIGACLILEKLVKEFHPKLDAHTVIWFLLIFPTAIFFNAVYTEALFLLLSVATTYLIRKGRYREAGIVGFFAALTRITGVVLLVLALAEFFSQKDWRQHLSKGLWLLLIPAGLISFFLYHAFAFGNALIFFQVERNWGRTFTFDPSYLAPATSYAMANFGLDIGIFVFGLIVSMYVLKRVRPSYGLYMLATIGVAFSSGTLLGIGRYLLVLFPIPIALASLKPEHQRIAMFVSTLFLAFYTMLFVHYSWSG